MWYDTSTNLLKMRNADDDAFITLAFFDQTNDEWEVRSAVIQAVDSAGVQIKTDDGTTRISVSDAGQVSFENYSFPTADGTDGQVLTTDGSGNLTFEDGGAGDKIEEGNSSVEVVDTGTGRIEFTTDGSERMRIDSSGNLKFDSGYGSAATAYGCRAWVNFNGTGTVAIRGSGNVSSITDDGTGRYTVNFTTAMPDDDYCVTVNHAEDSGEAYSNFGAGSRVSAFNTNPDRTTTAFSIQTRVDEGSPTDMATIEAMVVR
jgi:hypothetical protein